MTSVAKILVKGQNFPFMLDKLRRHGVSVLKLKRKSEKEIIITVKYRDLQKAVDILGNSWYNSLIGLGGLIAFLKKAEKNLLFIAFSLLFIASCYIFDTAVIKVDVTGLSGDRLYKVYRIAESCGIKDGVINFNYDLDFLKKSLFTDFPEIDFVTVKKSGNRLVINVFSNDDDQKKVQKKSSVSAKRKGKILKLKTYSGTPLKKEGDYCDIAEVLVDGYYLNKAGERIEIPANAYYLLECTFETEYFSEDLTEESAYIKALIDGGVQEETVVSYQVTVKNPSGDNAVKGVFAVKIIYLYQEE